MQYHKTEASFISPQVNAVAPGFIASDMTTKLAWRGHRKENFGDHPLE